MNRTQAMELDGQIRKHLEEYSFQILQSGR